MKFIKKYGFKILIILVITLLSCYVLFLGIKKSRVYEILKGENYEQKIFTIWHVETSEGGGKARKDFLLSIAKTLEKENEENLFMLRVIAHEKLSLELELSTPDIISFGFGVGQIILPYLHDLENTYDVRDELISSGSFNKKFYAVPFMVGGYAMFSHSNEAQEFHCGQNGFTKPNIIFENLNLSPNKKESQYEAYKNFANNKNVKLLGTSRDLFRVNNLNKIGRTNAMITPIDSYTDLIQYLGITNHNAVTEKFVSLAMSQEYQSKLVDYSLFSSLYNKIYYDGIYSEMEDAIYSCQIPNAFHE